VFAYQVSALATLASDVMCSSSSQKIKWNKHKKTAGGAGGFWKIRTFTQVRSELSTAAGA
jgi:hypothetical protein